jgi:uncharacterized protein (DUF697 family)
MKGTDMPDGIANQAKAIFAGVGAIGAYLLGVLPPDVTDWVIAFGQVTVTQYIGGIVAVLAAYGITWAVPNRGA